MNESKATRYQRLSRRAQTAARVLAAAGLAAFALTPLGHWSYDVAQTLAGRLWPVSRDAAALVIHLTIIAFSCEAASLPAEAYRSRWVERAYGRPAGGEIRSRVLSALLLLPLVWAAGAGLVLSVRFAGPAWWGLAGTLLALALLAAAQLGPWLLGRLGGVRPLGRPALAVRVAEVAIRAGVPVSAIQEWRTDDDSPAVAMVAGLGPGRRVLLATDVVRHWSDDEVTVVVAHELAHHVHHDLLRATLLNAAILGGGLLVSDAVVGWIGRSLGIVGGAGVADPAGLPLVGLIVWLVWLGATPLRHAQSRHQERRADRFALATTGHAEAFVTAIRRASARHLAEERPTAMTRWLFHRHPSVPERLALAQRYLSERPEPR
jgi:STE24 endopeptidase